MGCDKKNSLITEDVFHILNTLEQNSYAARIVGGAVRNFLLNKEFTDIDIATSATPQQTTDIFKKAGLPVIPLGKRYGTLMVRYHQKSYEISTLREDIKTFGRQAEVQFTNSFEIDSSRRDFTVNALYMDKNGEIFDYHNGLRDIKTKNIRFIGDARTRIKEDYLRILRYFRFTAQYGEYKFNNDYLAIISELKSNLTQLSSERIYKELIQLFSIDDSYRAIPAMTPILHELFGMKINSLQICNQLGIFDELSRIQRLCMLLKFSDTNYVHKYQFPSYIKQAIALPFSDITNVKRQLKQTKQELQAFYIKYLAVKWFADGISSKHQILSIMHDLIAYCDDGYATFPLKASHLKNLNLSEEQLKNVMIATRNFWKIHDNATLPDCLQFAKNFLKH